MQQKNLIDDKNSRTVVTRWCECGSNKRRTCTVWSLCETMLCSTLAADDLLYYFFSYFGARALRLTHPPSSFSQINHHGTPRQRLGRAADRILGPERPEVFGAASALAPHFFGLVEFARFGRSSKQRDGVKKTGCRSDRDRQRRGRRGCENRSMLALHCRVSD